MTSGVIRTWSIDLTKLCHLHFLLPWLMIVSVSWRRMPLFLREKVSHFLYWFGRLKHLTDNYWIIPFKVSFLLPNKEKAGETITRNHQTPNKWWLSSYQNSKPKTSVVPFWILVQSSIDPNSVTSYHLYSSESDVIELVSYWLWTLHLCYDRNSLLCLLQLTKIYRRR